MVPAARARRIRGLPGRSGSCRRRAGPARRMGARRAGWSVLGATMDVMSYLEPPDIPAGLTIREWRVARRAATAVHDSSLLVPCAGFAGAGLARSGRDPDEGRRSEPP